ncbi:TniQ family protein [Streptomyces flavidovirens]|uniref:TniQ family protein n=1 Tax=Streptomyces flavidovirens TaxID=67298 RepID=UPI0033BD46EB
MITAVSEPLRRLALVPEPHPGESLLSWVDALARTNRVSRMRALRLAGFVRPGAPDNRPPVHFGSRVADETAERVYAATGLPPQRLHQMTLMHYARGILPEPPPPPLTPQSVSSWLARHRIALPTRSRDCPPCLRETGGRWLLKWRLIWSFACTRHRVYLISTCRGCGESLHRTVPGPGDGVVCRQTSHDRCRLGPCSRVIHRMRPPRVADEHLLACQRRLDALIENPHRPGGHDVLRSLHQALEDIRIHYDDAPPLPHTDPAVRRRRHNHRGAQWYRDVPLLTATVIKIAATGGITPDTARQTDTASWSAAGPRQPDAAMSIPLAVNRFGGRCHEGACPTWVLPGQGNLVQSLAGSRLLCPTHAARVSTRARPRPLTATGWYNSPATGFLRARLTDELEATDPADEARDPHLEGRRLILDACEHTNPTSKVGRALHYAVRTLLLPYTPHPDFDPRWLLRQGEHPTEALGQPSLHLHPDAVLTNPYGAARPGSHPS